MSNSTVWLPNSTGLLKLESGTVKVNVRGGDKMNQKIWVELDSKELQKISGGDVGDTQGFVWWLINKFFK